MAETTEPAAPHTLDPFVAQRARSRRLAIAAVALAVVSLGLLALAKTSAVRPLGDQGPVLGNGWWWLGAAVALVALALAWQTWSAASSHGGGGSLLLLATTALVIGFVIATVVVSSNIAPEVQIIEGRRRRRRARGRRHRISPPGPAPLAGERSDLPELTDAERHHLHAMWTRAAHFEAESVGSFLQLEAELRSLDAPAELVAWAGKAAADEVDHANIAGAIAARLAPTPTPASKPYRHRVSAPRTHAGRTHRLARLAVESLHDGVLNEGAEARRLAAAAASCHPALAGDLTRIAADEADHAELAWAIIDWTTDAGGPGIPWLLRHTPAPKLRPRAEEPAGSLRPDRLTAWGAVAPDRKAACIAAARADARRRRGYPPIDRSRSVLR